MKVLFLGGYGVFGGRLAQLLAEERGWELPIAGRDEGKARRFSEEIWGGATPQPEALRRVLSTLARLRARAGLPSLAPPAQLALELTEAGSIRAGCRSRRRGSGARTRSLRWSRGFSASLGPGATCRWR